MTAKWGVTAAFELSWQELDPPAQKVAALLSLFALAEIPWEFVQQCLPEMSERELERLRDCQLVNLSLLEFKREEVYQLHQLLREFFAVKREQRAEVEKLKESFCQVIVAVAKQTPEQPTRQLIEQVMLTIPHITEAVTVLQFCFMDEDLIICYTVLGRFHEAQATYEQAKFWYRKCCEAIQERLGRNHLQMAASLYNLAWIYHIGGQDSKAERLYLRALAIREQQLERNHPDVAESLSNLALIYFIQARYEEAEPFSQRALLIYEQQAEPDLIKMAAIINNVGLCCMNLKRAE